MKIPVSKTDLSETERQLLLEAFDNDQLTYGPMCKLFEEDFASYIDTEHALVCSSGTTALHLALLALGVGPGDEVLVPNLTFVATANAVRYVGATPVLVDISEQDWGMSHIHAGNLITPRTRAIIAVHLYGRACNLSALRAFGLPIIEDAAEGLGGRIGIRWLGTIGDIGTFSFYGNKVMTTGEGGCVVTDNSEYARRIHHFRGQAMSSDIRYYHSDVGYNYRMTEMQAAVGLGQLSRLHQMLQRRREIFRMYRNRLRDITDDPGYRDTDAPWLYTFVHKGGVLRSIFLKRLAEHGIETRPTFVPLNYLPMYATDSTPFPISTRLGNLGISLPTYSQLTDTEIDYICEKVLYEYARL